MLEKILNNATLMSWSKAIVNFGSAIFVMPLILAVYSPVEQAFWFLVNSIIGFALLADSGFGSVLVRAASYFKSGANYLPKSKDEYDKQAKIESDEPNYQKLTDLIATTSKIYSILTLFVILLMATGGIAFIWNIMELANHRIDFWISYAILIPTAIFMILNIRWASILRGLNFIAVEARFSTLLGVIRVIVFAVLLTFGLKPLYLVLVMFVIAVINHFYIKAKVLQWLKKNSTYNKKGIYDKQIFSSLWSATWRLAGISWGNYFVEASNSLLAAQIPDARAMANFLFTARILDFVKNLAYVPFYSNISDIYSYGAKKEFKLLKKKFSEYFVMGLFIIISAFLAINLAGNPALKLLGIETEFIGITLITIMCLSILFDMHASFHASIYTSTNHIPFFWPSIISGALVVILGRWATPYYGLLGIITTRFLVQFSFSNWYAVYLNLNLLNWKAADYLKEFPVAGIKGISQKVYNLIKLFSIFKKH
ncbi:MAG: hypothetical protein HC831_19440 [Chloroflexia bacterium]|nr:hypothetical protein [Chloroflexia bacterium]